MSLLSIGKFAKQSGISQSTLRKMHKSGKLVPSYISSAGTRYYTEEQLQSLMRKGKGDVLAKPAIGYCRVSTPSQKDDLQTQVDNVRTYMCAKGYQFEIIEDVGSGINYTKSGLQTLIRKINNKEISKVVVLYNDRLVCFGFELIEYLCALNDVELEIIDNTTQSKEQELSDDLIQIVTVFANRLYGQRSKRTKQLIKEVKNNVNGSENSVTSDA